MQHLRFLLQQLDTHRYDVPKAALTQILLNHVVSGSVKSTDLTTTYIKTLAKGTASTTNNLSMFVNTVAEK
jgi:hypothetical protein